MHIDPFDPAGSPKCGECLEPAPEKKVKPESSPVTLEDLVERDPVIEKLALIDAGLWCMRCNTPTDHHNECECLRKVGFLTASGEIEAWLAEHQAEIPSTGFVASTAMRRAHLRLGRDMPSATPGMSFMQEDGVANRKRYHGERAVGKYRRPTVTDPSELPI